MINLHLTRGNNYEGVYLRLPATPGEVGEAFGWLDEIDTEAPTKIIDIVSNIPNLFRYLCHADIDAEGMLGKFQEIAVKTNGLTKEQSQILTGALDAESINGPDDILSVIDRLDEYAFIPNVTCDKELGGYLVDRGYMDVPSRIRPYLDYHGIGAEYYAEHGGAYINQGYVLRKERQGQSLETEEEPLSQTVRKWYEKEYPEDELGHQISDITFSDIVDGLNDGKDIYGVLGVGDSIVRERVFGKTADLLNVGYDDIYYKWLYGDEQPDLGSPDIPQDFELGGM